MVFNSGSNGIKELREIYKHHDIVGDEISIQLFITRNACIKKTRRALTTS